MLIKKPYQIFLDDERSPIDVWNYTRNISYAKEDWVVIRNYNSFIEVIIASGLPQLISFDHDLADVHYGYLHGDIPYDTFIEKTGYHCALWLIDYCIDNNELLPEYLVHSMNPVGGDNIRQVFANFRKFQRENYKI